MSGNRGYRAAGHAIAGGHRTCFPGCARGRAGGMKRALREQRQRPSWHRRDGARGATVTNGDSQQGAGNQDTAEQSGGRAP